MNNLCLNCFEINETNLRCSYCGYSKQDEQEASHHMPPGTQIAGKYLIGKVLGQGGFGITYLCWDTTLEIKMAVKEFFPLGIVARSMGHKSVEAYSAEMNEQYQYGLSRFLEEAKTVARFSEHPNIVTVKDIFKANGTAYMVMNYIEGLTLEQYLQQNNNKIPFGKALQIMMPIMDALREIHSFNLMHRDISPDNIFIRNDGRVMLIDFGAARQELQQQSRSISVIMKAGYSPLEQYQSKGKQGPWTDIYAVAATLYRSCTGIAPPEAFDRLEDDPLELPSKIGADIKANDEAPLLKAIAVRAADRFQDIEEMQKAFLDKDYKNKEAPAKENKEVPINQGLKNQSTPEALYQIAEDTKHSEVKTGSTASGAHVYSQIDNNASIEKEKSDFSMSSIISKSKYLFKRYSLKKYAIVFLLFITLVGFYFIFGIGENTVIPYTNGIYRGQVSLFKPHGTGTLTYNAGGIYMGGWVNGKRSGFGTYTWPNGNNYEGEWLNSNMNGHGILQWANGSRYEGEWLNGSRHGYGRVEFVGGNTYAGGWEYDRRSGSGEFTFTSGTKIIGEWQNNVLVTTAQMIPGDGNNETEIIVGDQVVVDVGDSTLLLRIGPGKNYNHIDRLNSGAVLTILGRSNDWLKVETPDNKTGWVHSDYVNKH